MVEYVYEHSVDQYHYIGWPDFGAPTEVDSIIVLAKAVRKLVAQNKTNTKVIVHCSAGVGRTGTFIALYHYMKILDEMVPEYKRVQKLAPNTLEDISDKTIDIFNHVFDLRKQRCEMVQSFPQYEFLHKCIVAYARELEDLWEKENLGSESKLA